MDRLCLVFFGILISSSPTDSWSAKRRWRRKKLQLHCTLNLELSLRQGKSIWKKSCSIKCKCMVNIIWNIWRNICIVYISNILHPWTLTWHWNIPFFNKERHSWWVFHYLNLEYVFLFSTGDLSPDGTLHNSLPSNHIRMWYGIYELTEGRSARDIRYPSSCEPNKRYIWYILI